MIEQPAQTLDRQAIIVVDLGFGDSGKGSIVDYLARTQQARTIIRFNGGAQAAHNVVTPDGRHHTFSQFGSGTFIPGIKTYLSRFMLVEPYAMFNEEQHLSDLGVTDAFARTLLDRQALIISPFQQAANRLKELARGANRHGSCGMGIGETISDFLKYRNDVLLAGDLPDRACVTKKLCFLRDAKWEEIKPLLPAFNHLQAAQDILDIFEEPELIDIAAENYHYLAQQIQLVDEQTLRSIFNQPGLVIFEGAQGVLLDENFGFAPYTTWSNTTFANALELLNAHPYGGSITRLGVLRTYFTRHGAGPFVTEEAALTAALPELHNANSPWQQDFRGGYFDLVAARYALEVADSVDALALTHVDKLAHMSEWKLCNAYHYNDGENALGDFFEYIGQTITRIKKPCPPDLNHQYQLTQHLFHCTPQYETLSHNAKTDFNTYVEKLEESLGVTVAIMSSGMTAHDKQLRWSS